MHGFTRSHYFSSKIVLTMKTVLRYSLYTLCASLVLMACKKDQKTVPIQLLLTDNPAAYDSVNIHIQGIQVKMNSEESGWLTVDAKDTTVNLLDLQNGVTMVIAQDEIPEGVLKEVRFILSLYSTRSIRFFIMPCTQKFSKKTTRSLRSLQCQAVPTCRRADPPG